MDRGRIGLVVLVLLLPGGCAQETKITRVDSGVVTDLSGRWNDTDSRIVAESMVKEALEYPWLNTFSGSKHRQPVVVVGTILNNSHEHIDVNTFVSDLERELTNSQKVTFVAGKGDREELRTERKEQAMYAREETQKAPGKEIGADYMMKGTIATILDEADGTKAMFYQIDLQMVDLESNAKVWFGQKKIKKVIEKKRTVF
ncbi:MAG: penicillin-binding protein activator LpoB [Nitrospirae bacterium]|nr:penicillin-binding protein activator LpoB [Nitrospirota bacterium]MBU6480330.1 penicillin-binding protein activator LpoB [Nitrospirota bacterium]MDE3040892.1 penicillin-binding protein activator LpoB [Nitrospirota bacterium]MDE3049254.1 penicillin-binding protein activator LpoB [Nitrospirota bacterium]MDE3220273.1 penicillin-binding protein activator LpoB [Nitrospirota bacterium]